MNRPQLYVFAGPNGAGKSSVSSSLMKTGTPIFDGDKEFLKLKKIFDQTDSGALYDAVNGHIFTDWKEYQLSILKDCAFETNFRSAEVMDTVKHFKANGYEVHLLFFGLDSIEASIQRVQLRVAGGGHDVSPDNIKANYVEGLKNLYLFSKDFNTTTCYQNLAKPDEAMQIEPLMIIENGIIIEQVKEQPNWLKEFTKRTISI
jgi:predicted ABC-type ATPase